jgi:hypothetical protein
MLMAKSSDETKSLNRFLTIKVDAVKTNIFSDYLILEKNMVFGFLVCFSFINLASCNSNMLFMQKNEKLVLIYKIEKITVSTFAYSISFS